MPDRFARCAVYYTPASGPLQDFGDAWLGYSLITGQACPQLQVQGLPIPLSVITSRPSRYGFHATIQAPFTRAATTKTSDLLSAIRGFAKRTKPFDLGRLQIMQMGAMLALMPENQPLNLATDCVETLASFRTPLDQATFDRYNSANLTARQRENLQTHGYPYVIEDYRFHMTLSDRLSKAHKASVEAILKKRLHPLLRDPITMDTVTLVGEREDGRFQTIERFTLRG